MTEAEWLQPDSPLAVDWRTGYEVRLTRRAAILFAVACVRATPGVGGQRRLLDAVWTAEEAADTDRWEEIARQHQRADAACGKVRQGSTAHQWAIAALDLTAEWVGNAWTQIPMRLLRATSRRGAHRLRRTYADLMRDVVGNPFQGGRRGRVEAPAQEENPPPAVALRPEWLTDTVVSLANGMYADRDFAAMPILADALQDAGCEDEPVLAHCRGPGPHVRGCWVVDLVLGKS